MKKTYTKPIIMFENFTMSTNIAGDCEPPYVGNHSKGVCAVIGNGGIGVFSGDIAGCDFSPTDLGGLEDEYNGLCYHVPVDENSLFNS